MNLFETEFATLADLVRGHARSAPHRVALIEGERRLDYAGLDALADRVAHTLQRHGVGPGDAIAICAGASIEYVATFLGALRAGVCVAPLAPGATPQALGAMLVDAGARFVFVDRDTPTLVGSDDTRRDHANAPTPPCIALDGIPADASFEAWLCPPGSTPGAITIDPRWPFNIIYSSGTTGAPKGIVQAHAMRWAHIRRGAAYGYGSETVTLLATPLYSNTTLVVLVPTLAFGGCIVLMRKFDAGAYLALAQQHHVTHTMLVPVQYQRLMARPDFARFDLSSFQVKFATSAPFAAALKADVLARWPGRLIEFYGMTEGGGTCILEADAHPTKLHTVGRPAEGHDIRLIDDAGLEIGPGESGEVVGHSPGMMTGYHGQPGKTREAEWFDPTGKRFIRTGDVGRFDADGFLILFDRKKDLIISGGFNVYPSDLEDVLRGHPAVADVAVVGVASSDWGETPAAFVVLAAPGVDETASAADELKRWANQRLGKTQRLSHLEFIAELPRSAIGKVLKRELRDRFAASARAAVDADTGAGRAADSDAGHSP
jgi:long-chain acyl-CoA synthetase